jgi:2-methylcitrate dehydratase PrpD
MSGQILMQITLKPSCGASRMAVAQPGAGSSLTEQLVALLSRTVSQADRVRASLHLLDWLGCAILGRTSETGAILSSDYAGADLLPRGGDPQRLAFALGGLGSVFEMDDIHRTALLHPGPVVIPAALAFGPGGEGAVFLDAIIAGYEAMIRIGRAIGPAHYALYHNSATCGGFGAAAAAGRRLGLSDKQLVWALGNAGSVAGGLWQCRNEPVMTKAFHFSDAARRGVGAAILAERGLSGPRHILEGPQGLFAATAGDAQPASVVSDADAAWLIFETSFKPWPACRHAHAAIDAALLVREAIGEIDAASITGIEIETFSDAVKFCDRADPQTTHQAKFSLQHCVAVVLTGGAPKLADFEPEKIAVASLAKLRAVATVVATPEFTAPYPAHFGSAVTVTLSNGQVISRKVADALGDSENPLDEAGIIGKFMQLAQAAGASRAWSQRIADAALSLAHGAPLSVLDETLASTRRAA